MLYNAISFLSCLYNTFELLTVIEKLVTRIYEQSAFLTEIWPITKQYDIKTS